MDEAKDEPMVDEAGGNAHKKPGNGHGKGGKECRAKAKGKALPRKRQMAELVDVEVEAENAEPGLLIQKNRQCLFCF